MPGLPISTLTSLPRSTTITERLGAAIADDCMTRWPTTLVVHAVPPGDQLTVGTP